MRYLSLLALCFAVGCGATNPSHGGGSGGTGGGGGGGSGGGGGGGSGGGGGGGSDCSDAAKLIYVIDSDGTLSSFKPNQTDITKSVFTDIGHLNCNAGFGYQPFSMSVDRSATAWVEYYNQATTSKLFKVSTANAACTATTFMGGQQGLNFFGMGFVSNAAGSTDETLYIAGGAMVGGASNLGMLDMTSFMVTKGSGLTGNPELTGTGLAELWGFFPDVKMASMQAHVSKIDKTASTESNMIPLPSVAGMASAWAFAFYGGDFFVFLAKGGATVVYHVTTAGGTQPKDQLDTMTRHIVGAGVSTCAPTVPIG